MSEEPARYRLAERKTRKQKLILGRWTFERAGPSGDFGVAALSSSRNFDSDPFERGS